MINYITTSPKPVLSGTDATYNEMNFLKSHFGGNIQSLSPLKRPSSKYPILFYGLHNLRSLKRIEKDNACHQIYAPAIFHLPVAYAFKKPIVYNIVAGLNPDLVLPRKRFLHKIRVFVVSNESDKSILNKKGIKNVEVIRTGIDTTPFSRNRIILDKKLHLMMSSAPWELKQFESKGIHLLFESLKQIQDMRLTLLWRNVLPDHLLKLVAKYNLESKITLVNEHVNVNDYLAKVHGTILLTNDRTLVKSYPHSLIESILAGKPIITSQNIPISIECAEKKCGLVLDNFDVPNLVKTIAKFRSNYKELEKATNQLSPYYFSLDRFKEDYKTLYRKYSIL